MPRAAISSQAFLVEGGCNACGLKNTETFTIHFEDQRSEVLEAFDLPSLVQAIAQKNGWREAVIPVGIGDEEIILKNETAQVKPIYLGDQMVYQTDDQRLQVNKTFEINEELFKQVNEVLVQLFKIEPYEIKLAID